MNDSPKWNVRSQIIRETQDTEIRIYDSVNKARVLFFVYKYMQCKHRNFNFFDKMTQSKQDKLIQSVHR